MQGFYLPWIPTISFCAHFVLNCFIIGSKAALDLSDLLHYRTEIYE
jgi:hypothetical protein